MLAELDMLGDHLSVLAVAEPAYSEQEPFQRHLRRVNRELRDLLKRAMLRFRDTPYPFGHAHGQVSVAQYLTHEGSGTKLEVQDYAGVVLARLKSLYARSWRELAALVEQVEAVFGMAPEQSDGEGAE